MNGMVGPNGILRRGHFQTRTQSKDIEAPVSPKLPERYSEIYKKNLNVESKGVPCAAVIGLV